MPWRKVKCSYPRAKSKQFIIITHNYGTNSLKRTKPHMSHEIEGAIDIDFFEVLTLTIDIELTIFE